MKKLLFATLIFIILSSLKTSAQSKSLQQTQVFIDLNIVKEDKVMVSIIPPSFTKEKMVYHLPKTVPGTYSTDNYGKYVSDLKAFDKKGNELKIVKIDENSWEINDAKKANKITYWVDDTYDKETGSGFGSGEVFSPAGTNILGGKNFMLNNHGFVGYFDDFKESTYSVTILHPENLFGATSLIDSDKSTTKDVFITSRYHDFVDNPIMYAKSDITTFIVDGMEILFSVYSPNGIHTAKSLSGDLEKVIRAQKTFLGSINANKKYTILLYLSDMEKEDAKGFGALEHNTSTSVVFPEAMPVNTLSEQLKDVVSHEFFHIVTPLSIHSKEIHYFDYNAPKMSQHLWMYEGVTEYFANLFQINQSLITESEFYTRMAGKIANASTLDDTMPFTKMSVNVLDKPYKDQYLNVYEKGALIGMCIDIIIREKSNGERGILDLMGKLSKEFGAKKPFDDAELFSKITSLTFPEVGDFLKTYVSGETPINYDAYFNKMGVTKTSTKVPGNPFLKGQKPYITVNPQTKEIIVIPEIELNDFFNTLGLKGGDIISSINDKDYNLDNIYDMIMSSQSWKDGDNMSIKIKRDGTETTLTGKTKLPTEDANSFEATDKTKTKLKEAWLKG